ncbi:hypothetical protein RJ640_022335 [Escallonia rubra]|uniref:S-locus glycoprotein domain-containing protein n=1 Tax=Escallonia rubra TaxID=112253 RepID=A0AA88QIX6_9ASTE|nr:hypothetical protein RJ640_022335 [Escallonia rubra]
MKPRTHVNGDEKPQMTSWRSPSDPSIGSYSLGLVPLYIPQLFIWNGTHPYWRSGPWNGQIFIGIPKMYSVVLNGFSLVNDGEGSFYLSFVVATESVHIYYVLNWNGTLTEKILEDGKQDWEVTWLAPEDDCDIYGKSSHTRDMIAIVRPSALMPSNRISANKLIASSMKPLSTYAEIIEFHSQHMQRSLNSSYLGTGLDGGFGCKLIQLSPYSSFIEEVPLEEGARQ